MHRHPVYTGKRPFELRQLLILLPLFVIASCGGGGGDTPPPPTTPTTGFSKSAELIGNAAGIMRDSAAQLDTRVAALDTSVIAYCDTVTVGSAGDATKRTEAQDAFKAAMNDLQRSSMHALGPALADDRMKQLYSWPTTSHCGIDQKLAVNDMALNLAVNRRGMDALEYLLFVEPNAGHACPAGAQPIVELTAFNALSNADRQARRCAFMLPVAADAAASAQTLADAWDPAMGNYVATMTGTTNAQQTLNEVTDAMYFFREVVREFKLDRPLNGLLTNRPPSCGSGNLCPQDVESFFARISKGNIRSNVLAFQELYWGGSSTAAVGFDDWLREAQGNSVLADRLDTEIQTVLTGLDDMSGTLFDTISSDPNPVNALLAATHVVSQTLRHDMFPALGLKVPQGLVSDTD